jgi:E3 ubiquitin-protein ligase RNF144
MDSATTFPAINIPGSSSTSSPVTTTIQATQVIPSSPNHETLDPKAGQSPEILCGICAESKERDQMFTVESCTHSFCSDCIIKHVASKIQEGIYKVSCPGLDCKAVLELEACTPVLPKSLVERWNEALFEALMREEQWKMCPRCSSYVEKTRGCLRITCRSVDRFVNLFVLSSNFNFSWVRS